MKYLLFLAQIRLMKISYHCCGVFNLRKTARWIIGVEEIASMLNNMAGALENTDSLCLYPNPFYRYEYNMSWPAKTFLHKASRLFIGPILLGYLANKYEGFVYLGAKGFLLSEFDGRNAEFDFIKSKNKGLVTMFLGTEIRSHILQGEYSSKHDLELVTAYQNQVNPGIDSQAKEEFRRKLASAADEHADTIFNPPIDQMTYIERATHDILYFYPNEMFKPNDSKWRNVKKIKIFHGPSSPIIKGTPLVRAAIKKLRLEGYNFDYDELSGVPHEQILEKLTTSHIVLNQFYAQVPGVFGVEAMANGCLLLTSADPNVEPSLPIGAEKAWVVAGYWNIYDRLKAVLDMPLEDLQRQAEAGYEWTFSNYSATESARHFKSIINHES